MFSPPSIASSLVLRLRSLSHSFPKHLIATLAVAVSTLSRQHCPFFFHQSRFHPFTPPLFSHWSLTYIHFVLDITLVTTPALPSFYRLNQLNQFRISCNRSYICASIYSKMHLPSTLLLGASFIIAVVSQNIRFTNSPGLLGVTAGQPTNLTWSGGDSTSPVTITLKQGDPKDLQTIAVITGTSMTTLVTSATTYHY